MRPGTTLTLTLTLLILAPLPLPLPLRSSLWSSLPSPLSAALPRQARAAGPDADPWWARDKALHLGVSAALATGGYGAAALVTERRDLRLATGAAVALSAGVAKELADLGGAGDPSWRDLTWDVVGTATGVLVAFAIDHLLTGRRPAALPAPLPVPAPVAVRVAGPGGAAALAAVAGR